MRKPNHHQENTTHGTVYTLGHSNAPPGYWVSLLKDWKIEVVVDIRSVPHSRNLPQANQENVRRAVESAGMRYLFLGDALGGRPKEASFYRVSGAVDYDAIAASGAFQGGLARLLNGVKQYRVCLLCSEEEPSQCHRALLVGKELAKHNVHVEHIRHNGKTETQEDVERRLPGQQWDLFSGDNR